MIAHDTLTDAARAKDRIARAILNTSAPTSTDRLGAITLRPHQIDAVERLGDMLRRNGGAVLADAVGLGKTFIALGVAREYAQPLVVAPAALRDMWARASHDARMSIPLITTQALSMGAAPPDHAPDLIIVDEAHHFRSHLANRYAALASLCAGAHVLLLSATPVQNRREDLLAQLALFLGSRAAGLSDAELGRYVIRRDSVPNDGSLPAVSGPHGVRLPADDALLDDLLALPAPLPASDEGIAGALATYTLLHLWSSSRAALVGSLRRRRARAHAMRDVLASGRMPSRRDLAAWRFEDGAQQLAMADLLFDVPPDIAAAMNVAHVDHYIDRVTALLDRARTLPDPDQQRAEVLETLLETHRGERIVVFSQYAETVTAMAGWLRRSPGICVMTARGARIASGAIPRADVLAQFDASDSRSRTTRPAERIDMLVTTDVLSEGVNLHDASVVVHLDLPWNPARLEQRVGRVRRLGSRHDVVTAYTVMPPAPVDRMLGLERRLRTKLGTASDAVGAMVSVLPDTAVAPPDHPSAPNTMERIRTLLMKWRGCESPWAVPGNSVEPIVTAVAGDRSAILAAVACGGDVRLVAGEEHLSRDPATIGATIDLIERATDSAPLPVGALVPLTQWLDAERARVLTSADGVAESPAQREAFARIGRIVDGATRDRWPLTAALASAARSALTRPFGVGSERELAALNARLDDDTPALHAFARFGERYGRSPANDADERGTVIAAIIVVVGIRP